MRSIAFSTLAVLLLTSLLAQADTGSINFTCENRMFRQAMLSLTDSELVIQDSYIEGTDGLKDLLELGSQAWVQKVKLQLPRHKVHCQSFVGFMVNCQGANVPATANITYFGIGEDGTNGLHSKTVTVMVKTLVLDSNISSRGELRIGNEIETVTLNQLNVTAELEIEVNQNTVDLKFETFFYTDKRDASEGGSACQKL